MDQESRRLEGGSRRCGQSTQKVYKSDALLRGQLSRQPPSQEDPGWLCVNELVKCLVSFYAESRRQCVSVSVCVCVCVHACTCVCVCACVRQKERKRTASIKVWLLHLILGALKNWCFQTLVLEKTLKSPLDSTEIKPVHSKGNSTLNIYWKN